MKEHYNFIALFLLVLSLLLFSIIIIII